MSCEPDLLGLEEVPLHVSLQAIPAKVGQGRGGRECYAVRGCRAARPRLHDITSCLAPHPPLPPYARDPPTHAAPTSLPPCLTHPHWPAPPAPPPPPPQLVSEFQAFKHMECLAPGTIQKASAPLEVTLCVQPTLMLQNALPYEMRVLLWQHLPSSGGDAGLGAPLASTMLPPQGHVSPVGACGGC